MRTIKADSFGDINFFTTGGTVGCHNDNLHSASMTGWRLDTRRCQHHDNCRFTVNLPIRRLRDWGTTLQNIDVHICGQPEQRFEHLIIIPRNVLSPTRRHSNGNLGYRFWSKCWMIRSIITWPVKCGMKLLIISQTSTAAPLKFLNG